MVAENNLCDGLPILTNDNLDEMMVVATQEYSPAWHVFDNTEKYWTSTHSNPQSISWKLNKNICPIQYSLRSDGGIEDKSPSKWTLQAWDYTLQNWVDLDYQSGIKWSRLETKIFDINTQIFSNYFRVYIHSNGGNPTFTCINEIKMKIYNSFNLIKSKNKYYAYKNNEFVEIEPTVENFRSNNVNLSNLVISTYKIISTMNEGEILEDRKIYRKTINVNKYKGIKKIEVK